MQLERCAELRVPLPDRPIGGGRCSYLLSDPLKVMRQLLSGEQLEQQGAGVFLYTPRPLELPGIRLAPLVHFRAEWNSPLLAISLVNYQLPGLAGLERKVKYHFRAELQQTDGDLLVRAEATLELASGEGGLGLPQPLLALLGNRALGLIFGRLERRCRRNLPALVATN